MYCKFCKKQVSDGKYCNVCGNKLDIEEKKLNNIMSGIDWFQTFMMIGLIVWLVLYIVIGVIVVYNANGKKGGYDDYSIAFSFFVIMFDFITIPYSIGIKELIVKEKKLKIGKTIAIILTILMIVVSIYALYLDDNSLGAAIKFYVIPIIVYSFISLIIAIKKLLNKNIQK